MFAGGDYFLAKRNRFPRGAFDDDELDRRVFQKLGFCHPFRAGEARVFLPGGFARGIVVGDAGDFVVGVVERGFVLAGEVAVADAEEGDFYFAGSGKRGAGGGCREEEAAVHWVFRFYNAGTSRGAAGSNSAMPACSDFLLGFAIADLPPVGGPRYIEYEETRIDLSRIGPDDATSRHRHGWSARSGDGSFAGGYKVIEKRYFVFPLDERTERFVYDAARNLLAFKGELGAYRCAFEPVVMPPPDGDCARAARLHYEGFVLVERTADRVVYFHDRGHRVEMSPGAGCEVMLEQRGLALGNRTIAPAYTYRVTRIELGEPRAELFRRPE